MRQLTRRCRYHSLMVKKFSPISRFIAYHRAAVICISLLIVINALLGVTLRRATHTPFPEISQIESKPMDFKALALYFSDLANKKGGAYAFEILKRVNLPQNIDVHLIGHVIGDILYKQEGAEGIKICTQDFRNACSHTIVIGMLLEKGPESFGEVADICRRAPGGPGAYTMCFHGLGHGVLAFNDYELPKAVEMCREGVGGGREWTECVGGAIMEMVSGVHDVAMWKKKSQIYFMKSDPLYPCSADFMPEAAKGMCYTYLTPHLFEAAGGYWSSYSS
jgi:hypothetical protein